ncbi:MAG TPA: hypothetical protein VMW27_25130 [Thermoanaerobaculia bacterium]|nr:hypothetical protein [Thermoanaerobaculia bacterium]
MKKRLIGVAGALALALGANFVAAEPPTCEVLCVTSPCSKNSDCNAAPNGTCNFVCPRTGCCEYR